MKYFLLVLFLIFKISHAESHSRPVIEGYECEGPDQTVAMDNGKWGEYYCTEGEWFLSLDGNNPITVRLQPSKDIKSDEYEYFTLISTLPVNAKTRWILRRYWMRVAYNGDVDFIPKR